MIECIFDLSAQFVGNQNNSFIHSFTHSNKGEYYVPPSSSLLSKNLNIKIYRIIIFPVFVWVWNLVADIEGGTQAEGVGE